MSFVTRPFHGFARLLRDLWPFSRAGLRRWRRAFYFCLALLGLFWLAEILLLPMLVRYQLTKVLGKLGFPNATFVVRSVTTDRASIENVRGNGIDEPTIASAVIRFSPWNIIHGQLGEIDLIGARVIYDPKQGADNLGHRHHKTLAERLLPDPIDDFPFDRIVLQSSELIVRTHDHEYSIPTSGTLTRDGFDRCTIETQSQINGAEFDFHGQFNTDQHTNDMQVSADAIGLGWLIELFRSGMDLPIRGGGIAGLKADFHDDLTSHHLHVSFDPHDAWMEARLDKQSYSFDRADCHVEADFDDRWQVARFLGSAKVPHATIAGKRIRDITMSVSPVDSLTYLLKGTASASLPDLLPPAVALHQIDLTKLADVEVLGESMLKLGAEDSKDFPWRLDDVKVRMKLPPSQVLLPARGVTLQGVYADLQLAGTVTPETIQMTFAPEGSIGIATADIEGCKMTPANGAEPIISATLAADSKVKGRTDALADHWEGNVGIVALGRPIDFSAFGTDLKGLEGVLKLGIHADPAKVTTTIMPGSQIKWSAVKTTGASISGGQIDFGGTISGAVDQPVVVDTAMHLDRASLHLESAGCDFEDMRADIPLRWNVTSALASDASRFSIGSVTVPSAKLPGMTGSIAVNDGQLGLNVSWPIVSGAVVNGAAKFAMSSAGPVGTIKLEIPEFKLTDPKVLADIFPASKDFSITGDFSGSADLKIEAGKLTPHASIASHSVHIESTAYSAVLDDVNSRVEINSLKPLATPGDQAIYVGSAKIGKLSLTNGEIHYRIENLQSILVEKTIWDFAEGKLRAESFRIDPSRAVLDVEAQAENLSVKALLATFIPDEATGTGIVYGRVPLRLRWPRVFFGKGFLYAAPGQGQIQVGNATEKVAQMLDDSDPRFKTDDSFKQIKARAVAAMKDFQYDVLKVDWENSEDGVVGAIHLSGKGKGDKGQGLNLNLNFTGLDKALTRYLIIQKGSDRGD